MKSTNEVMYGASVQLGEINIGRWRIRNQNACDLAQKKNKDYFSWISHFAASALFSLSKSVFLHMCASILEI